VNLGETPSSELVHCVLWVIRLTKTVESICCAVRPLWHCRELSDERYAHHIQFEFWLLRRLTPAVTDRPPSLCFARLSSTVVSCPCYLVVEYLRFGQRNMSFSQPLWLRFFWFKMCVCFFLPTVQPIVLAHLCFGSNWQTIIIMTNVAYISVICGKVSRICVAWLHA